MSIVSIISYNNGEHLNSIIEYANKDDYSEMNDNKYAWICPNPVCNHFNKFENNIIMERSYCNGCNSFISMNKTIQELFKTLSSLSMHDDEYLHLINILNENNKEIKNIYLRRYSKYTTNIYKEINGKIVIINKIVNDKIEEFHQYIKIMEEESQKCGDEYFEKIRMYKLS
jgi:hypothetical protein